MAELAGWASQDGDNTAHHVQASSRDPAGRTVYTSLCGRTSSPLGWQPAAPAATRCVECQNKAAGTPD